MSRERHTLNGKLLGYWIETAQGHRIYAAVRQMRHLNHKFMGWAIDTRTLDKARERGYHHVAVVCKRHGQKYIWLTPLEDFWHEHKSFVTQDKIQGRQRGVRLKHFAIDPANDPAKIERLLSVR